MCKLVGRSAKLGMLRSGYSVNEGGRIIILLMVIIISHICKPIYFWEVYTLSIPSVTCTPIKYYQNSFSCHGNVENDRPRE